ncbi:MAG: hypothetical protein AABY26_06375 [Nanoarchaeota archaeon]
MVVLFSKGKEERDKEKIKGKVIEELEKISPKSEDVQEGGSEEKFQALQSLIERWRTPQNFIDDWSDPHKLRPHITYEKDEPNYYNAILRDIWMQSFNDFKEAVKFVARDAFKDGVHTYDMRVNPYKPALVIGNFLDEDAIINEVERELKEKDTTEIESKTIGSLTAKRLKKIDKVAYIRFSSVFRRFVDLDDFEEELKKII